MVSTHHTESSNNIAVLKTSLTTRLSELVRRLYPDKALETHRDCLRVGNHGSLAVDSTGVFFDHETGVGGDCIDLIQHALRCDFKTALHWAQSFLGCATVMPSSREFSESIKGDFALRERQRMDKALSLWHKALPALKTLAETYLRSRGIMIAAPASMRFLPRAWNYTSGDFHPAVIAAVQNAHGKITGAQVIYLTDDGQKISGDKVLAKLTYGIVKGGAVRLAPFTPSLVLCEGVEDGLSILQSCPDLCVWATLGTANLINVQIPDSVTDVVIASDNDMAGLRAARALAARLIKESKQVRLALPTHGKDFNAQLQEMRSANA